MELEKTPFVNYKDEQEKAKEKGTVFSVRLSDEELNLLKEAMQVLEQSKQSTALKMLFLIGHDNVIHDRKTRRILELTIANRRKNKRLGVVDFE